MIYDFKNFQKLMDLLAEKRLTMDDLETILLLLMVIKIDFKEMLEAMD